MAHHTAPAPAVGSPAPGRHAAPGASAGMRALLGLERPATPASPARRYAPQPRIPDYVDFCAVAEHHSALWEVTYGYGTPTPYQARHRVRGYLVNASDLALFDHLLRTVEPPAYARPYVDCVRTQEVVR